MTPGAFNTVRLQIGVAMPEGRDAARAMREDLEAFCHALGKVLGIQIHANGFGHYDELLEALHLGMVDLAWLPPVIALRAAARGRTLPVALPVRAGSSSFWSALFTRPGSDLTHPRELQGAHAAWVDPQSAAGYLMIRASLRAGGVDLARAFGMEVFLGSHEAVVEAVLRGDADVGATFVHLDPIHQRVLRAGWGDADARMLAYAGPIPADVIAASIHLPVPTIRAVMRALGNQAHREIQQAGARLFGGAEGFLEATPEHLEPVNALLGYMDEPRDDTWLD